MRWPTWLLLSVSAAYAHGAEQWIADKQLVDPVSKQWCCGESDCKALSNQDVKEVGNGYWIKEEADTKPEFISGDRALPFSPDGRYHRCAVYKNGEKQTRCLIVPPRSS